jgi:hypothetical protein
MDTAEPVGYARPVTTLLYPSEPLFPPDGGARRAVWEALRDQLPNDAALFAGVRVRDDRREHEIDLLVAWPGLGLAAVAVHGGQVLREGAAWFEETESGPGGRRRIDPSGPVRAGWHVLRETLRRRGAPAADAVYADLLALPHTYAPGWWEALDLPRTLVVDRGDLTRGQGVAERVASAIRTFGAGRRVVDHADVAELAEVLAGGSSAQDQ